MKRLPKTKKHVVCVHNEGYQASLEKRKIYIVTSDHKAEERHLLRIKDESGQSYLYPSSCFIAIQLPQPVLRALAAWFCGTVSALILSLPPFSLKREWYQA